MRAEALTVAPFCPLAPASDELRLAFRPDLLVPFTEVLERLRR